MGLRCHIACKRLERAGTGAQTPERLRVGAGAMRFDVAAQYVTPHKIFGMCAHAPCLDGARSVAPPCMLMVLIVSKPLESAAFRNGGERAILFLFLFYFLSLILILILILIAIAIAMYRHLDPARPMHQRCDRSVRVRRRAPVSQGARGPAWGRRKRKKRRKSFFVCVCVWWWWAGCGRGIEQRPERARDRERERDRQSEREREREEEGALAQARLARGAARRRHSARGARFKNGKWQARALA